MLRVDPHSPALAPSVVERERERSRQRLEREAAAVRREIQATGRRLPLAEVLELVERGEVLPRQADGTPLITTAFDKPKKRAGTVLRQTAPRSRRVAAETQAPTADDRGQYTMEVG